MSADEERLRGSADAPDEKTRWLMAIDALALDLASLPREADLYAFLSQRLRRLTGAVAVAFSEYDPDGGVLVTRAIDFAPGILQRLGAPLLRRLEGTRSPVSAAAYEEIFNNANATRKTLTEASFGAIPVAVSFTVRRLLDVDRFVGLAHVVEGALYGTSVIALKAGAPDPPREELDYFAALAAVSLRRRLAEDELRLASAYNRSLIEASLDALVTIGPRGTITDVNEATVVATGFAREKLLGTDFAEYFTEPARARAGYERAFREGTVRDYALQLRHRDGRLRDVFYNASIYRDAEGRVAGVVAAAHDVTEQRRAEAALRESEARYHAYFEQRLMGVAVATPDLRFVEVNQAACDLLGYSREEFLGLTWVDLTHVDDVAADRKAARRMAIGESDGYRVVRRFLRKDGGVVVVDMSLQGARTPEGEIAHFLVLISDVTERQHLRQELERRARYDELTGLYNRSGFAEHLDSAAWKTRRAGDALAVLFCDVDRFKAVNDAYGHDVGDAVLRELALRIKPCIRRDDFAARFGGDEMLVILAGVHDLKEATSVAEKIRRAASEPIATLDGDIWVRTTLSVGVAWAEAGDDVERVTARADRAMYYAKRTGRDRVIALTAKADAERRAAPDRTENAQDLHAQLFEAVKAMGAMAGIGDPFATVHEHRVAPLAAAIAAELGLSEERCEGLALAGAVHDIGKIVVPGAILNKPGALDHSEMLLMRRHAKAGREILESIHFDQPVAEIVGQHHERLDGSGYPEGLKGEEIRLEARALAVADVVEAMASRRPYRPALGLGVALAEVRDGAGTRFDGDVVAACERVFAQGFAFQDS